MFGRTILGVLAVMALVALVAFAGTSVYNAGVSQGLADAASAAAASGDPVPVVVAPYGGHYGYGYGGPGFFGIFFWILGFFLIFGLLRAAFGWGRWGGGGPGPRRLGVAPGADVGAAPGAASARRPGIRIGRMTTEGRVARASVVRPLVA